MESLSPVTPTSLQTSPSVGPMDSLVDVVKPFSNSDGDLFGMFSKFSWDDLAGHHGSELSQVLSPPDLFSVPLFDSATTVPKDKISDTDSWGLLSNPAFYDVFGSQHAVLNPNRPAVTDLASTFPTLNGMCNPPLSGVKSDAEALQAQLPGPLPGFETPAPAPVANPPAENASAPHSGAKPKKTKRKKGRPELQRKKRSEMNERFKQLKQICHPGGCNSTVIGRGDRSTNSKEGILRLATAKISRMKKEIAQLEKQLTARRSKRQARTNTSSASSVSSSSSSASKAEELDHSSLFRKSAIARLVMTLDGAVVAANRACAELLDLDKSQLHALRKRETIFTLVHPETLPLLFQNLSLLLSGNQSVTYIIDGKGPVTPQNRMAVWSAMSWISGGPNCPGYSAPNAAASITSPSPPVFVESLIVQTGCATPSESDLIRFPLSNLPNEGEDPMLQTTPEPDASATSSALPADSSDGEDPDADTSLSDTESP
jgi:PAS domain-containing protein